MAWAVPADPPPLSPVTVACVVDAAYSQHVPLAALVAIVDTERGQVGRVVFNRNKTYDMGPAGINSTWLAPLATQRISRGLVLNNGCVNVLTGAWILLQALLETKGDVWAAIGVYHSHRDGLALDYQRRVYQRLSRPLKVAEVVARANRSIGSGGAKAR